jgi:hypothetical protein
VIVSVLAARLVLDFTAAGGAATNGQYGWAMIFLGAAVVDAGSMWLMLRG